MFIVVPSISKARKVAFDRIKMTTGVKQVVVYPITDNLVYVITGSKVDKDDLKPAVAVKKLIEKKVKVLFVTEDAGKLLVIEIKDNGEVNLFHYEKAVQPLLVHFLDYPENTIQVVVLEHETDIKDLVEKAKKEVEEVKPEKLIEIRTAKVNVTDEDLKAVIKETSIIEKIKEELEKRGQAIDLKKVAVIGIALLLIGGGYYGYTNYKSQSHKPVKPVKKQEDYSRLNSKVAGFLFNNLDKIGFAVIENGESYIEFEKQIEKLPVRYMGYYYVYEGKISGLPNIFMRGKGKVKAGFYPAIDREKVEKILEALAGEKRKVRKLIVQKIKEGLYSVDVEI